MNADAFRHLYDYHFAQNRMIWYFVMQLSQEQFTQPSLYSLGSVRNQIVHLMNIDDVWFTQLTGASGIETLYPDEGNDRADIRAHWDEVVERMRTYLAALRDDMLFTKPFPNHPEDKDMIMWQVLQHVANHGTDHRAQILRLMNDLGLETPPQDYAFYVYEHPTQS
jgi:uncharacterized damage-inducible protein DinB